MDRSEQQGQRLKYDDLLAVPYKEGGRDISGMDCYGYVIELCRRAGNPLNDIAWNSKNTSDFKYYRVKANVKEIARPHKGALVQCEYKGLVHLAYLLDAHTVTHMTFTGVKINTLEVLRNRKYFEVIK